MLRWIIQSSLNFRYLILILGMILVVYGTTILNKMSVDVFPEFSPQSPFLPPISYMQNDNLFVGPQKKANTILAHQTLYSLG